MTLRYGVILVQCAVFTCSCNFLMSTLLAMATIGPILVRLYGARLVQYAVFTCSCNFLISTLLAMATPCAACSCSLSFATCASWASSSDDFSASRPSTVARSASSCPRTFLGEKEDSTPRFGVTSVHRHGHVNSVEGPHKISSGRSHADYMSTAKTTTYRPRYRPHTDHVPTTYRPCTDHIPTTLPTTYRPCTDNIPTMYRPHTDHVINHIPTTYRQHTDHVPTTFRPRTDITTALPTP